MAPVPPEGERARPTSPGGSLDEPGLARRTSGRESSTGAGGGRGGRKGRRRRREATGGGRGRRYALAGLVVVLLAVGLALGLSGGTSSRKVAHAAVTTTTTSTTTTTVPPKPRGAMVATTKGGDLGVYDAPDGTVLAKTLSARTDYDLPRTVLVTEQQSNWLKVLRPIRPNHSEGWIKADGVTISEVDYRITIARGAHQLTLFRNDQPILQTPVVVGKPQTPTPLGLFYVTDPIDLQRNPNGAYGAYALGLSGYSEVLLSFNGGPGQIAIHGTPDPSQVGKDLSNGCIRVPNDAVVQIARVVPLGTPVDIVA